MTRSRIVYIFGALAAVLAVLFVLFGSGGLPVEPEGNHNSAENVSKKTDGPLAHAKPPSDITNEADARRTAATTDRESIVNLKNSVLVRGRVCYQDGTVPKGSIRVEIVPNAPESNAKSTVSLLGGKREVRRLQRTGELDAKVRAMGGWKNGFDTFANERGEFQIRVPREFRKATFLIEADYAIYKNSDTIYLIEDNSKKGPDIEKTLFVDEAGSVELTVLTDDKKPAAGAWVNFDTPIMRGGRTSFSGRLLYTCDDAGKVIIRGVTRFGGSVWARTELSAPTELKLQGIAPRVTTKAELILLKGETLRGAVVDESGRGIGGVAVTAILSKQNINELGYGTAKTDASGKFTIHGMRSGVHRFDYYLPGKYTKELPASLNLEIPLAAGSKDPLIVMMDGNAVSGKVVGDRDEGLANVVVFGSSVSETKGADPAKKNLRSVRQETVTSADGTYRLAGLADEPFAISAVHPERGAANITNIAAGADNANLTLATGAAFSGTIKNIRTGEPVSGAEVAVTARDRRVSNMIYSDIQSLTTVSDAKGNFTTTGLQAGKYDLRIEAFGFMQKSQKDLTIQTGEQKSNIIIDLDPDAVVRGKIEDPVTGQPIAGADVRASLDSESTEREEMMYREIDMMGFGMGRQSVVSGLDGTFEIRSLASGKYRIVAQHEKYADSAAIADTQLGNIT
ncbi:MAG: carboxypeptidase regulatory-like domain-containing protein, partial [Planctomycetota bacterium]